MHDIPSYLTTSSKLFPIEESQKFIRFAKDEGVSQAQINAIAERELAQHGTYSSMAEKAKIVGLGGTVLPPIMAVGFASAGLYPQALFLAALSALSFLFFLFGRRETTRAAFTSAVLRAKAKGMSHEQISILKDDPALRGHTDTQLLLTEIQEGASAKSSPQARFNS